MKKFGVFILIVILCSLIAGTYGMLHDQLTYTISPEYYTKFKFIRMNIDPALAPRLAVCEIGFLSTWWAGIFAGVAIGAAGFIHRYSYEMRRYCLQGILLALIVTFITGLIGLGYGFAFESTIPREQFSNLFIPEPLQNYNCFIAVATMHDFSYVGGAIGLLCGTAWQFLKRKKKKKN